MTTQDDSFPLQWFGPRKPAADDRHETVRQELEQCTDADLEAIDAPRFMFRDSDPEFRARVTLRQRVAQELLDERAQAAETYQPEPTHTASRPRRWWQAP